MSAESLWCKRRCMNVLKHGASDCINLYDWITPISKSNLNPAYVMQINIFMLSCHKKSFFKWQNAVQQNATILWCTRIWYGRLFALDGDWLWNDAQQLTNRVFQFKINYLGKRSVLNVCRYTHRGAYQVNNKLFVTVNRRGTSWHVTVHWSVVCPCRLSAWRRPVESVSVNNFARC